jgi:tetratricopeptide (TPR) repeat protein
MIGKKKKITKKELQEDKLVTTFYKSQEFIDEHKQKFILGIGALAVIILAVVWYSNKQTEDNLLASAQLFQIIPVYEQGQYQKAIDGEPGTQLVGLKNIAENYGNTENGELAKIYLAHSYYALGDYENALEAYSDWSGDSKLHQSTALAGMAASYEMMGKYSEAAENYEKAAKVFKIDSQSADFLLNAGINYIKSGDKNNAKNVLELVKNEYKTTTAAREVEKYLAQL